MMSRLRPLQAKIEEFLICGPVLERESSEGDYFSTEISYSDDEDEDDEEVSECSSSSSTLQEIGRQSSRLAQELEKNDFRDDQLQQRLHSLQSKVHTLRSLCREDEVLARLREHLVKQHKLQLLVLADAMRRLERCTNILEIPALILGVKQRVPRVLVEGSKMKEIVLRVVAHTRRELLHKFHAFFEEQLNEESLAHISQQARDASMWEVFLRRSRDWLLAYSLVSLLSVSLTQSPQIVLETFQSVLDEALTPMWGRFYHHLKITREAKSPNQIVWTFSYAKSFIEMLLRLCSQITLSDHMRELCDVGFEEAAVAQVLEKALKFLRAHIAQVFVDIPYSEPFLMQLVEEIVEFDEWLAHFPSSAFARGQGLCGVVFDAKETFHQWITLEHRLLTQRLETSIQPSEEPFSSVFHTVVESQASQPRLGCYNVIYTTLTLFIQMRARYSCFPAAAQLVLSELILEPLLCFALGLLLFRIRSSPELYRISVGETVRAKEMSDCEELESFRLTVSYFQTSLSICKEKLVIGDSKRCKKRWTIVQNWIPKILVTAQHEQQGFSMENLLKTAMKASEKFRNQSFEYRSEWTSLRNEVDSIEDCVTMTRGLAITLVDVLEKQFNGK